MLCFPKQKPLRNLAVSQISEGFGLRFSACAPEVSVQPSAFSFQPKPIQWFNARPFLHARSVSPLKIDTERMGVS